MFFCREYQKTAAANVYFAAVFYSKNLFPFCKIQSARKKIARALYDLRFCKYSKIEKFMQICGNAGR